MSNKGQSIPEREQDKVIMSGHFELTLAQAAHYKELCGEKSKRRKLYILMVEDQLFLRRLLSEVLKDSYEITIASTAEEGWLSFLETAPDITFLDIGLPDANGHMLAQKIKEFDPYSYVVMLTASNQRDDVERAKKNHVDGFMTKPFSRNALNERIAHYRSTRR